MKCLTSLTRRSKYVWSVLALGSINTFSVPTHFISKNVDTGISSFSVKSFPAGTCRKEECQGNLKKFCVPGLNCYSCPAASGACPVGALQAVSGSSKFTISFYVTGFLMMLGVLLGRFVCGFLCPFGWFQELLHKIPSRKFSTKE